MLFLAGFTGLTGFPVIFDQWCHSFILSCVRQLSLCDIIAYDLDIDSNLPRENFFRISSYPRKGERNS